MGAGRHRPRPSRAWGPNFYGFRQRRSTMRVHRRSADRVDVAFQRAIAVNDIPQFPLVQQAGSRAGGGTGRPPLLSLVDQPAGDIRQALKMLGEDDKAFQQRQKRSWQTGSSKRISARGRAHHFGPTFSWGGFDAIVARNPAVADGWKTVAARRPGRWFSRAMHAFRDRARKGARRRLIPFGAAQLFARIAAQAGLS